MNSFMTKRGRSLLVGLLLVLLSGTALADDSEIFSGASATGVAPNILLILDTSGSMASQVTTQASYDPTQTYTGSCTANNTYISTSSGTPSDCSGLASITPTYQKCQAAVDSLAYGSGAGGPGFYTDQFVQWRKSGSGSSATYSWSTQLRAVSSTRFDIACEGDYPSTGPFPTTYNGTSNTTSNEWTSSATGSKSYWKNNGNGTSATLYSGNYLNFQASNPPQVLGTRISVVKSAATSLISSLSNVNIGLMRYSNNGGSGDSAAEGGMVVAPVLPVNVPANKANLLSAVSGLTADGYTPLSETLYEAYLYYSGGTVHFGANSVPVLSIGTSLDPLNTSKYKSPIQYQCQKNFIVYLTDGLPTQDNHADTLITGLPNESAIGGSCDNTSVSPYNGNDANGNPIPGGWGPSSTAGKCMTAMAKYLYNGDLNTSSAMPGQQNVSLYTIGFGDDPGLAAASTWLQKAATAGGGQFYAASDLNGLQSVLTNIVTNILKTATTFTAPAVAVNAFNRTQTLNDLYMSVFQPNAAYHWPGNVKKYEVANGTVVDANNVAAVDPATGFFKDSAQSLWSASPDGAKVPLGGAAQQIPDWNPADSPTRNLYTYVGTNKPSLPVDLTAASSSLVSTNTAITYGVTTPPSTMPNVTTPAARDLAIAYARGEDLRDADGDSVINEQRHDMGDSLHSQPAVVIYGGQPAPGTKDINDGVIFAATNDGFVHAIDVSDGHELWAFIPQEYLTVLTNTYSNVTTSPKHYSIDGTIKVLKYDINGDGIVDPTAGDRVLIFFGTGRGGSRYYAMDVTYKNSPKFLWSIGPETTGMSGIGQTWSSPVITHVNVSGPTQNSQKIVLIFGGGYDPVEDNVLNPGGVMTTIYQTADTVGNGLYMIDALYGTVLWSAGPSTSSANLKLARMDHSIPSDVSVIDLDGDGFADRMYVGDMAGQLWRFDITNNQAPGTLVAGGVIASLGAKDVSMHPPAEARRFYNPPDVAAIRRKGQPPFFNIAIGSGYRGHPLDASVHDRFYSIRDTHPYVTSVTQTDYNANTTFPLILDADTLLTDVTPPAGSPPPPPLVPPLNAEGWKLQLNAPSWQGEKVLANSVTFNDQIIFPTYTPSASTSTDPCVPGIGANAQYTMDAVGGGILSRKDLADSGIAPPVTFLFPPPTDITVDGPNGPVTMQQKQSCTFIAGQLTCQPLNGRQKTFWRDTDAN